MILSYRTIVTQLFFNFIISFLGFISYFYNFIRYYKDFTQSIYSIIPIEFLLFNF
jgi:hypothetical protein